MKYVITVNPHGGKKLGPRLLNRVKPLFEAEEVDLFVIETTYAGHAQDLAHQLDFSEFDGFLAIGGDGTLHEVVNGMLSRPDKQRIPIGIIPGGSGNSYMHDLELTDPIKAAKAIIQGNTRIVDAARVEVSHVVKYAMNVIGWGLVTDVGRNAERHRWLGTNRYTIISIIEVMRQRIRSAALLMDDKKIEDEFTFIIACNSLHVGKGMKMAPKAKLDDGLIDVLVVRSGVSRGRLLQILPKLFKGTHIDEPEVEYYQTSEFSLIPQKDEILNIDGEMLGSTPITVKMLPKAIEIYS
ncbi:MAG: diacylglycerol kinase family lipid kinase [Candidatus Marinimicrobia bacterium]|jgi:YegS/Rv2252/BmrU family lipid kinase|nr:diacylglycerol kinase family lipid kinase [Candidatus Neomarinimicrobiota bacterium]MDP6853199.1 diacylglycerol kinase family lipid kinase [Candidatus Neomarinimicrobiota bacterium]